MKMLCSIDGLGQDAVPHEKAVLRTVFDKVTGSRENNYIVAQLTITGSSLPAIAGKILPAKKTGHAYYSPVSTANFAGKDGLAVFCQAPASR